MPDLDEAQAGIKIAGRNINNLNCGFGEDSWESLGLQGDQPWDFFGGNDAEAETPVLWPPHAKSWLIGKDSDAGRDWGQEEKGTTEDEMASLTRWTWVWVNSGSWWWTGRPAVLWFMGSQRVGHDWETELNWRYTDDTILMIESEEGLKSPLTKVKEDSEKAGLKLNLQKTEKSGPITS